MLNSFCKTQGEFFMKKDNEKKNFFDFLGGFTIGYFLTDFIFSLFKSRKK